VQPPLPRQQSPAQVKTNPPQNAPPLKKIPALIGEGTDVLIIKRPKNVAENESRFKSVLASCLKPGEQ